MQTAPSLRPTFLTRALRAASIGLVVPALLSGIALASEAQAKAEAAPGSPRPWLEDKVERAKNLSLKKVKADSPEAKKLEGDIRGLINEMLDWDELTQRSMGTQWAKLTADQQREFSKILREMIETSYESKMRLASKGNVKKPKEVKITWLEEEVGKNSGKVVAQVAAEKTKAILQFDLLYRDGAWKVYDVSIDDVSTVRTYRSQFRKIISDKGFDALVERMKSKIADIRSGRGDLSTAMD